jgi:hypothetical protein
MEDYVGSDSGQKVNGGLAISDIQLVPENGGAIGFWLRCFQYGGVALPGVELHQGCQQVATDKAASTGDQNCCAFEGCHSYLFS